MPTGLLLTAAQLIASLLKLLWTMKPNSLSALAAAVVLLVFSFICKVDGAAVKCHKSDKLLILPADIDAAKGSGAGDKAPPNDCAGFSDNKCFVVISDPAKTGHRKLGFGCGGCSGAGKNIEEYNAFKAQDANIKCEECSLANCNSPATTETALKLYIATKASTFSTKYQKCKFYSGDVATPYASTEIYCNKETSEADSCTSGAWWDKDATGTPKKKAYMGCKMDCGNIIKGKYASLGKLAECATCVGDACTPATDKLSANYPTPPPASAPEVTTQVSTKPSKDDPKGGSSTSKGATAVSPSNLALTAAVTGALLVLAGAAN